jgi:pimeloyl-ACP methyl ester carboxylesterase
MKYALLFYIFTYLFQVNAQYQIGHTTIDFLDVNRSNRIISTEIYYPSLNSGSNTTVALGQFPVIIFGHGFAMPWSDYQNYWERYVPKGYILVFPKTESTFIAIDHQQFGWDIQFLVTEIQREGQNLSSVIYNSVALETALIGHSMGGGAAFLAADSLSINGNQNFKTLIGLAPAESSSNGVSSIVSASAVIKPTLIFSGSGDGVTLPIDHHIPMYNGIASNCKAFVNISGGGHCYFAQSDFICNLGEAGTISNVTITRAQQQQITYDLLDNWLGFYLKHQCVNRDLFMSDILNLPGIIGETTCVQSALVSISESSGNLISSVTSINYQWFYEDNPISGSNSVSIFPSLTGNYYVQITDSDGCSRFSPHYYYEVVGIEELTNNYSISPNPTQGIVTIKSKFPHNISVELFDMFGKFISLIETSENIDISFLQNGLYYLSIEASKYLIVKM